MTDRPPRMKMTTAVPDGIAIPDELDTAIGRLSFRDGVPDRETARKVYDNLDLQRAVTAYLSSIQVASMSALRRGILGFGPANKTVLIFESLMDSRSLWLTPNTSSVYVATWLDVSDGPMVIETPPNVLGLIDDHWFHYVADFGNAGPDAGQGGRYLLLPPGYGEAVPDGYRVVRTDTFGHWVIWRGFLVDGDPGPAVQATKEHYRAYALGSDPADLSMEFVNVSGLEHSTIHAMDVRFFEEVDAVVQAEPPTGQDPEILGQLAAIGIRKGRPFAPDARMRRILEEAASIGHATARTLAARPRDEAYFIYPGRSNWITPFVGGSYEFIADGARLLDARSFFHFYATGITPAMSMAPVGAGSQYACAYLDAHGEPLDGARTYRIHLPPDVPARQFWSLVAYDNQTRSMLQTDQRLPSVASSREGVVANADGSYDVWFGPEAPQGREGNWVQTVPGKGWNVILRLYGPLQPWFDQTWRPGDPEPIG